MRTGFLYKQLRTSHWFPFRLSPEKTSGECLEKTSLCKLCKNEARGFLCVNCNLGISCFNRNVELLKAAIEYLTQ